MDEDLIREANKIVNAKDISEVLKDLRELYLEDVALTVKKVIEAHQAAIKDNYQA